MTTLFERLLRKAMRENPIPLPDKIITLHLEPPFYYYIERNHERVNGPFTTYEEARNALKQRTVE